MTIRFSHDKFFTMKNIFKITVFLLLTLLISCEILNPPREKDDQENTTDSEQINSDIKDPSGDKEINGYFVISNNLGYDITALYAGDYYGVDENATLSEIGTLADGNITDELTPPYNTDFNIWYEYTDSTGQPWSIRLTSGSYGLLHNFHLTEGENYYLDFYIDQDTNNEQFRFSVIGDEGLPVVEDPEITISSNIINISCETKDAIIIYTLDGSTPTRENGTVYTANFIQSEDVTIKTFAYLEGYEDSNIITVDHTYNNLSTLPAPTVTRYYNVISLHASMISNVSIIYTLDGTTPTRSNGNIYTDPFTITEDVTLKAFEYLDDSVYGDSPVLTEELLYHDSTPTISTFQVADETFTDTVIIDSLEYNDDIGVTGFYIKLNDNSTPTLDDANWLYEEPSSITLPDYGSYDIYIWVRDTYGNISFRKDAETEYKINMFLNHEILLTNTYDIEEFIIDDINNDNLDDIIFIDSSTHLSVAYQQNDNTFNTITQFEYIKPTDDTKTPNGIAIGDINNDGLNDVIISSSGSSYGDLDNYIGIFYQNSNGTLDTMTSFFCNTDTSIKIGDVNNDGLNDIVGKSVSEGTIDIYIQNIDGTIGSGEYFNAPLNYSGEILIGDISGDNLNDIIVTDKQYYDPSIHILIQNSDGSMGSVYSTALVDTEFYSNSKNITDLTIGNFDDDSALEICITAGYSTIDAKVMLFNYSETDLLEPISGDYYSYLPGEVVCEDINNDSLTDIIYIDTYHHDVITLINNDNNSFTTVQSETHLHNMKKIIVRDINNDTYMDVVTISPSDTVFAVYWGVTQ